MKIILIYAICILSFLSKGQENLLPIHSFYKDQLFANKTSEVVNNGSFFPMSSNEYNLIESINDSSKQYYTVTEVLFKKHLFELKGKDYQINISPLFNFSGGRDISDTIERNLFQNTRGILVEANLFKNFTFATSFYENQGRFTQYESEYYSASGELYPNFSDSTYHTRNAVIPGGGRTKPFKVDGFDYAFAIGYLSYRPIKQVLITAGNNAQFVGDGHRSLLLSDNSYSAPYFKVDWSINSKFRFTYHRSRLMNLLRRSASNSAEAYYEPKGYSVNYFTYMPTSKINVSLFEGIIWNRGDSITSKKSHPLFYNPVPLVSSLGLSTQNEISSLLGINLGYSITKNHRAYAQLAICNLETSKLGIQVGYRGYRFFGLNDLMLQVEFNSVPAGFYNNPNPRLNYIHYNLPLAHSKGQGFNELLIRANYEFKRVFFGQSLSMYFTKDYSSIDLLPIYDTFETTSGTTVNSLTELGYRFNRKLNLELFTSLLFRADDSIDRLNTTAISIGLRTNLINHYKDF